MPYGFARLVIRFRWLIVAAWAILLILGLVAAPRVLSLLKGGFGEADTESRRALRVMQEKMGTSASTITIVFSSDRLTVRDPAYRDEMARVLAPLDQVPEVQRVVTFYSDGDPNLVSADGSTTYAVAFLGVNMDRASDLVPQLRATLGHSALLRHWLTDGVAIFSDLNRVSEKDLRRAEFIAFPLVLVALVLVFGGLVAAGLPLLIGGVAVVVTLALVFLLAQWTSISIFVLNIASFLGLGMAVDYSLLVVSRFREELARRDRAEAIQVTLATAGRAILFSGLTSVLGLSGLLLFQFSMLRSVGIGGVFVILMAMLAGLTLLPALLYMVGPRVNMWKVLPVRPGRGEGMWRRIALGVMRHPLLVAVPVVALLVVLGQPFLHVRLGEPWASVLPRGTESRDGWEVVQEKMGPGELVPLLVVVQNQQDLLFSPQNVAALYRFTHQFQEDPRVARVESVTTLDPRITLEQYQLILAQPDNPLAPTPVRAAVKELARDDTTLVRIFPRAGPVDDATRGLVKDARAASLGPGLTKLVSGSTADLMDAVDVMYRDFPLAIIYVVITIYVVLMVLFKSVVLPLKAVLMNGLSIFASFGALVYIFQDGHFQRLLGFSSEGFTEATVPILMFCILFGLSMDYEVFLLTRVKEEYDATGDNRASVAMGLERTGRIITSAALILVLVSASFGSGQVVIVKALGLGVAVAVLIDATVVRVLLVPALMRVLGDWNWWMPRFLRRVIP